MLIWKFEYLIFKCQLMWRKFLIYFNWKNNFLTIASSFSENGIKSFLDEGLLMREFTHPNVLRLRGICFDENDLPMILLPYMSNGDLLSYIRDTNNFPTVKDLLLFALGIANGRK